MLQIKTAWHIFGETRKDNQNFGKWKQNNSTKVSNSTTFVSNLPCKLQQNNSKLVSLWMGYFLSFSISPPPPPPPLAILLILTRNTCMQQPLAYILQTLFQHEVLVITSTLNAGSRCLRRVSHGNTIIVF
jgi:hypothetical protein